MKIVIDIDEDYYELIKHDVKANHNDFKPCATIANGIPLPKGHGAIKDVSQIEIPMCEDRRYEKWVQVAINSAPTIIEADTGETDE